MTGHGAGAGAEPVMGEAPAELLAALVREVAQATAERIAILHPLPGLCRDSADVIWAARQEIAAAVFAAAVFADVVEESGDDVRAPYGMVAARLALAPTQPDGADLAQRLADQVRTRRAALGWTQPQLAAAAAVPKSVLHGIENPPSNPTLRTLAALAAALGCGVADLLAGKEVS